MRRRDARCPHPEAALPPPGTAGILPASAGTINHVAAGPASLCGQDARGPRGGSAA